MDEKQINHWNWVYLLCIYKFINKAPVFDDKENDDDYISFTSQRPKKLKKIYA